MRITTDQPSSGKPVQLRIPLTTNNGFVDTTEIVLAEAPDFSIPGSGDPGVTLDPADNSRELVPGEIFFETPLYVHNIDDEGHTIGVEILPEDGSTAVLLFSEVVPPGETILVPIQGLRLLKTDFSATNGEQLLVTSDVDDALRVHGSASEAAAATHAPNTDV